MYFSADMKYDEIVSIEGNGIEDGDYSFDPARNAIVLGKEYLSRLTQTGDYSFTVRTANGLTDVIVVSVFDALPPETADAEVKAYDKSAGGSLSFRVKANGSGLISVNGKGPDSGNYSVRSDGDDFTLTLSESFLRDLQNGPATITAVFTGGEIEFRLEISNSLASHFETGNDVLYDVRGEGDYTVNVQTNYGRMIGVNGNGISPDDYVFNHAAGTLTISGKFLSCGSRTEPYSILLDNGELTLVLSEPLKESPTDLYVPMYTYMEPENSVVLSGSDGWAEVRYAKPKTADFAGGVKFRYLFDVSRPVTVYVDFLSVPALAGSSFVFTLSSEDYKMYYDNGYGKSELFGVFAVGNTYLQTAYFGVQPEDGIPEAQISHELLKRSDKGYETFTFDIGNASSKIYFNGTLIRETDRVTRSSFKDGKIYLLFTPHFWQEKEGAAFRIRTEADPLSYTSGLILNTLTKKDVNIRLNTRNSVITGVYLDTDEGETPIGGCALTHDPVTGEAVLTIPADAILYSRGYDGNPKSVTVRTDGGSISVPLSISSSKEAEFYSYGEVFDLNEGSDVSFFYESNLDEIVRLEGANLTGNDYTIQNGLLTIRKDYLLSLETGIKTFRVVTSLDPDGKILSVNVVRSDPPEAENAEGTFDLYGGTDLKFRVRINENHSLVLYGNGVDEGCYAYSSENEVLTVKADYLNRLNVGEYVLWIRAYYTEFLYKEIPLKINVKNSLSPVFENGSATCEETYVSGSVKPLSLKVNANNGKLIDVAGGYVGADSFRYDATTGVFVFSGRWMETLDEGRTKIRIRFDNGTLTFTVNVKENEDASEPDSGTTKKGCRGAADGCALLSVLSLACGISIKKRRKSER